MKLYIIRYRLLNDKKVITVGATIELKNDLIAKQTAENFEKKGNFVEEIYDKTNDVTLYDHKKAHNKITLKERG